MPTTVKVVVGMASMVAVWLSLAITLLLGDGPGPLSSRPSL
jgi:hypothetical protein